MRPIRSGCVRIRNGIKVITNFGVSRNAALQFGNFMRAECVSDT